MNSPNISAPSKKIVSIFLAIILIVVCFSGPAAARPASFPLHSYIIQGADVDALAALVQQYQGTVTSRLDIIHGIGALLSDEAAARLQTNLAVTRLVPNSTVSVADDEGGSGYPSPATDYPDVVGADVTWTGGYHGQGVTVAVVDTGLGFHKGIVRNTDGKLRGRILGWVDFVEGRRTLRDPNGHGSHIAGIIANSQIGEDNEWNGIAPGVSLVGVRVLDENGQGNYERVIQGIQWVIQHKNEYRIRVLNLSLVSSVQSPYWADPLNQAVMQAWANGITVVVAAGNGGPKPMTVGVPGNNPYVITVGAFTDNYTPYDWSDDYITPFSSAGPTLDGFIKPDVVAPGAHMVSTMLPTTYLAKNYDSSQVNNHYFSMAGTSQSAAVVSGIAALILSKNPNLTPDQVKYRIMITAYPWVDLQTTNALYSMWQQGMGRVNAPDAVYGDFTQKANQGLNIQADLAGITHYEGFSYYDSSTGAFRLRSDFSSWDGGFGTWSGGFGTWSGGFGTWSGQYGNWSSGFGTWSGGFGTWSGGFGTWSGGFGTWSGGFGTWSGGFGTWSGGFGTWSGGFGAWPGSEPWAGTVMSDPAFVANFMNGVSPDAASTITTVETWIDEP